MGRDRLSAPAHVCGVSWGGVVALSLYGQRPDLVRTLVLADTYAGWKGSLPEPEVRARTAGVEGLLSTPADNVHPTLPGLFAGEPPREVVELFDTISADVRPGSVRVVLGAIAAVDLRGLLPRREVRALLVWGELDVRSPLSVAHQFARAIPHADLMVIPGAGHMSNGGRPDGFNAAVRTFCRRSP